MRTRSLKQHLMLALLSLAVCVTVKAADQDISLDIEKRFTEAAEAVEKKIESLNKMLAAVTNQVMMQQFMMEERTRSSGGSGIKTVRLREKGTKTYHKNSYATNGAIGIHVHANNIRTVGMGEFSAVINGIEFKTRHNDYRLYMPHRTNMSYGVVEEVPFPDVPPSVRDEKNVSKAIIELREYFKAWRDHNKTHRDFTNYFKPVLCYLEGAWTNSGDEIDEPFFSDRHFIDAKSWMELQQKARFVAYSGSKSKLENLATLPTNIMGMVNDTIPQFAQFNFRILCHPLKKEVPLDRFRVVDDLHRRLNRKRNIYQHERSRMARFVLSAEDAPFKDMQYQRGLLDELMEEVPGRNNYPGHFYDDGLDTPALDWDGKTLKDVSRYHRVYKIEGRDAFGLSVVHRGFHDDYFFAAMTNHTKVAPMSVKGRGRKGPDGKWYRPILTQRWTYAIPLEIIYLTPLHKWNPYNLKYKGDSKSEEGKTISANGRNGRCSAGSEFDGTNSRNYYITPNEFFGSSHSSSSADTTRGSVCVLDPQGNSRRVQAAGVRVFLPSIADVGSMRVRYPIFPVHEEGSSLWKELDSLKELVMDNQTYSKFLWKPSNEEISEDQYYRTEPSWSNPKHSHSFSLTKSQVSALKHGGEVSVITNTESGHEHEIVLKLRSTNYQIYGTRCVGENWRCGGHRISSFTKVNATEV